MTDRFDAPNHEASYAEQALLKDDVELRPISRGRGGLAPRLCCTAEQAGFWTVLQAPPWGGSSLTLAAPAGAAIFGPRLPATLPSGRARRPVCAVPAKGELLDGGDGRLWRRSDLRLRAPAKGRWEPQQAAQVGGSRIYRAPSKRWSGAKRAKPTGCCREPTPSAPADGGRARQTGLRHVSRLPG